MNGKGDKPRPKTVTYSQWDKNWESIFKKKKEKKKEKNDIRSLEQSSKRKT